MGFSNIRFLLVAVLTVLGLPACEPTRIAKQTMLVSITGVHMESNQALYLITLNLENLRVRAICRIPTGWNMAAGTPSGLLVTVEGEASYGGYSLRSDRMNELTNGLLLVERWFDSATTDDGLPYKIGGSLDIELLNEDFGWTSRALTSSNIVLEPADRCPAPME
jgi:hypothetical protein